MPSYYNLPACFQNGSQMDVSAFAQVPFYLAKLEAAEYPKWNEWLQLLGNLPWKANQGPEMVGVIQRHSPNASALFFPRPIQQPALKDVHSISEEQIPAGLYRHKFYSPQFNFVPSFQAFLGGSIPFAVKDLAMQVQIAQNKFIATQILSQSSLFLPAGQPEINIAAPTAIMNEDGDAPGSKTSTWLAAQFATITKGLTLRVVYNAKQQWNETVNPAPLQAIRGMPKENTSVIGKYILMTSKEAYDCFPFDATTNLLKSINLDLLFDGFNGSLFGNLTTKLQRFPLRARADGTFVAPEVYDPVNKRPTPNPDYYQIGTATSADYEFAFLIGDTPYKAIKVGAPPKEFAAREMSKDKFYSLQWNGEVRITDQFLIDCEGGGQELNDDGENLRLKANSTFGIMRVDDRVVLPIAFLRRRVSLDEIVTAPALA